MIKNQKNFSDLIIPNLNFRKIGITLSLAIGLTCISNQTASAYVDYTSLSIPSYKQEQSNWCWATSAQMSIKYLGGNKTQSSIVSYVKGSVVNQPGTDAETIKALNYGGLNGTTVNSALSFGTITTRIKNNQPMLAAIKWKSSINGVGHMFVVNGFYTDTSSGTQKVYYKDPWPENPSDNIKIYSDFLNNSSFNWDRSIDSVYVK